MKHWWEDSQDKIQFLLRQPRTFSVERCTRSPLLLSLTSFTVVMQGIASGMSLKNQPGIKVQKYFFPNTIIKIIVTNANDTKISEAESEVDDKEIGSQIWSKNREGLLHILVGKENKIFCVFIRTFWCRCQNGYFAFYLTSNFLLT